MIDMDEFERTMRTALDADASRAPSRRVPWTGPTFHDTRAAPRRSGRVAAAGVIAAATVAAFIAVGVRDSDRSSPAAFQPPGREFPIADLGPATRHDADDVTLAELSRDIGVPGAWHLTIEIGLEYQEGEAPVEVRCIEENSAMCVPEYAEAGLSVYRTATSPGDTNPFLWAWVEVPAGTAYVTYVDEGQVQAPGVEDGLVSLWQRPVRGVAVFPDVYAGSDNWDSEVAVAYSVDGVELGRVDREGLAAFRISEGNTSILIAELDPAQALALNHLTDGSLTTCLTEAGASFEGAVGSLPPDADAQAVWDQCVATTKAIVTARLEELDVTYRNSDD